MSQKLYNRLVEVTATLFHKNCAEYSRYASRWLATVPVRCLDGWGRDSAEFVKAVCASTPGIQGSIADALNIGGFSN